MPDWSHLARFIAVEDDKIYLGQLVDSTRDVGKDSVGGISIQAYRIEGSMFDGKVTKEKLTVKTVLISKPHCHSTKLSFWDSYFHQLQGNNVTTSGVWV